LEAPRAGAGAYHDARGDGARHDKLTNAALSRAAGAAGVLISTK